MKKKVIIVLGMHRSGTSAVTRGLKSLGVELGDNLMPPVPNDNETGFWEDLDLNSLNDEILALVGCHWNSSRLIEAGEMTGAQFSSLRLRAIELLNQKIGNSKMFGIKNPRMCKTMPFWQQVLSHCDVEAQYVITVRNPLSVSQSLASRNGFSVEKSYLLWLGHMIPSMTSTAGKPRVVIDYDLLMDDPIKQMKRVAHALSIKCDGTVEEELSRFCRDFLAQNLRHTKFNIHHFALDSRLPALAADAYEQLLKLSKDVLSPDDPACIDAWNRISSTFSAMAPIYSLLDQEENTLAERDKQIDSLSQTLTERDGQIVSIQQTVMERDSQITNLNRAVAERDGQITNLSQLVAEGNERQANYQAYIVELERAIDTKQRAYVAAASEADSLLKQLNVIMASRSWKLTAPLRWISSLVHNVRTSIFHWVIAVYHALPISAVKKQKLKNIIFRVFGFAFKRLEAYKSWKEHQKIQLFLPTGEYSTTTMPAIAASPTTFVTLPSANGVWEWGDYTVVKSQISKLKTRRRSQILSSQIDMIDIGNEPFKSAAARVNFPPLNAVPDVSIILPVFNNLKITLECLLSISAHFDSSVSCEIIVADDASTDETAQIIASIPNVRLIRNESNLGFLRNCNHALEHIHGNYVLYLNNDIQVTAGWLKTLLDTFDSHTNVGAVGPRFLYPDGRLQEAGAVFRQDGMVDMIGNTEDRSQARFSYSRPVDYISGACLMLPAPLAKQLGGFSEDYLPCYCEDCDLCLRVQDLGYFVYCNPAATVVHHLSKTMSPRDTNFKLRCISKNLATLQNKWLHRINDSIVPKMIAFYLPQYYPFPENDQWWGTGFTDWISVTKAKPNFVGHFQPRLPADLGFYDLRLPEVMQQQAQLARRYGIHGFCFYYYWFGGKRLLDFPIEQMLATGKPDFPFCFCWANENWTRRWDGEDNDVLIAQSHSSNDDKAVILDMIRFFQDERYIRIDGRPLILVYRVTLFPDFAETAARWRSICKEQGVGEIYIALVESFDLVHANTHPQEFGCDAAVEFPPHWLAVPKLPKGQVINPDFQGIVSDYRELAVRCATREAPAYTRFRGVVPGWDNTARRQNNSFCCENSTPGAFQAWLEEAIEQTRLQHYGDERLIFINAWNEWAEAAYLEPDRRFGHSYLEAVKNALDAAKLLRKNGSMPGGAA